MERIIQECQEPVQSDEPNLFKKFYDRKKTIFDGYINSKFSNVSPSKNDTKSASLRLNGNELYNKKYFRRSIEFFTKSLSFATFNSEAYGLALANRSAVFFMMKEYKICIQDIILSLKTELPPHIKIKVLIRKCECYQKLNQRCDLEKAIAYTYDFLDTTEITNKETIIQNLYKLFLTSHEKEPEYNEVKDDLKYEPNEKFLSATKSIRLDYDPIRGRHVIAEKDIKQGEVLFVEKAFVIAPVFTENKIIILTKCFHCLKDAPGPIPCKTCNICQYCDERCRDISWQESHQFECKGMVAEFWYEVGIGFPAFRAMLKGVKSGFKASTTTFAEDCLNYGDKDDNYPFFDKLISNMNKMINLSSLIATASVVLTYLDTQTDFFKWLLEQPGCPKTDLENVKYFIGGKILKHLAQLQSNSSTIEHWEERLCHDCNIPDTRVPVACGMYPSVSMMNHSCKTNIAMYYIEDTVIVKALTDINKSEEVFNSYGADCRYMSKTQRQEICRTSYNFECRCEICTNPLLEYDLLDSYKCTNCGGPVFENEYDVRGTCQKCQEVFKIKKFKDREETAQMYLLQYENTGDISYIENALQEFLHILSPYHMFFKTCYEYYFEYYLKLGDIRHAYFYFEKSHNIRERRFGANCQMNGEKLYEIIFKFIAALNRKQVEEVVFFKEIVIQLVMWAEKAQNILKLYYPSYLLNFDKCNTGLTNIKLAVDLQGTVNLTSR